MKWVKFHNVLPLDPVNGVVVQEGSILMMPDNQIAGLDGISDRVRVEYSPVDESKVYRGGDIPDGSKVAFYYPAAIGDAVCHTAILARFKDKFPKCEFRVFSTPQTAPVWYQNPSVGRGARGGWPTKEAMDACDVWLIADGVVYKNDTENVYDILSKHFCITLNDQQKRPWLFVSEVETDALYQKLNRYFERNIREDALCIFSPCASKTAKSWPIQHWQQTVKDIQEKLGYIVIATGDKSQAEDLMSLRGTCAVLAGVLSIREMIVLAHQASRVISVDSAMLHIAAAFDIPTVGLFGPFSPKLRSSTYQFCKNIFYSRVCPNAPCAWHEVGLPEGKCPDKTLEKTCAVLNATTSDMVIDELKFMEKADKLIQCNPILKTYQKA